MSAALMIPNCFCVPTAIPAQPCSCPEGVVNVDLVQDMAATTPYQLLKAFLVRGWNSVGDGFGGTWSYVTDATDVSDGYYVITPPGGVGRYIKIA